MRGRIWIGIILVVVGGAMLLDRAGVVDFGDTVGKWWPALLILLGIERLAVGRRFSLWPVFAILVGGLLLAQHLGSLPGSFWSYFWPALLILLGVKFLFPESERHRLIEIGGASGSSGKGGVTPETSDVVDHTAVLGGVETANTSQNFRGGSITAVMGGANLDLRGAKLSPEGAHLDVTAVMGGVEIWVPTNWKVEVTGTPILGGWDNKARGGDGAGPPVGTLRVTCTAVMGGIDIKN